MKILPTITVTGAINWRDLIKEARLLGLTEVAFFPTMINKEERLEAYKLMKEAGITKIPFVHLRSDIGSDELDLLIKDFGTEIFNIHPFHTHQPEYDLSAYAKQIYMETQSELDAEELKNFAGICIDISHVENYEKTKPEVFSRLNDLLKRFPIGCAHISAVRKIPEITPEKTRWAFHYFNDVSEFDYVKKYQAILPPMVALEVENSLAEQLKAKDYILGLLALPLV